MCLLIEEVSLCSFSREKMYEIFLANFKAGSCFSVPRRYSWHDGAHQQLHFFDWHTFHWYVCLVRQNPLWGYFHNFVCILKYSLGWESLLVNRSQLSQGREVFFVWHLAREWRKMIPLFRAWTCAVVVTLETQRTKKKDTSHCKISVCNALEYLQETWNTGSQCLLRKKLPRPN